MTSTTPFAERFREAIRRCDSALCLGLDPDVESAEAAEDHCVRLLGEAQEHACCIKANLAFFEQFGSPGLAVLERLRGRIEADRLLILDGKRGDIGNTAEAYARAAFDVLGADAVTVNPLMGRDAVEPFLSRPGRGAFLLTRTSNPGAADLIDSRLASGEAVYERIVDLGSAWDSHGAVGFVVGATAPRSIGAVRARAPRAPLLLPGVGAQGGVLEEAYASALTAEGGEAVIAVSRGISAAQQGPATAARVLRERLRGVRDEHNARVTAT